MRTSLEHDGSLFVPPRSCALLIQLIFALFQPQLGGGFNSIMPCFRPLTAYRFHVSQPGFRHVSGKLRLFFGKVAQKHLLEYGDLHEVVCLPCGKCVGCLCRRVADWALRCVYESAFWDRSSFLTLTYRTPELPANRSLLKEDHQKFFKRLRQVLKRECGVGPIRYYMCGEYGPKRGRPHYHVVLFGWDFPDRVEVPNNPGARDPVFTSPLLDRVWGKGNVIIGDVTEESAAYVARYTMKKLRGQLGKEFYAARKQVAPYTACSKGIGRRHFERYRRDHYPSDEAVTSDGRKRPVPRYFDKLLESVDAELLAEVKHARVVRSCAEARLADQTPERLRVREECLRAKLGLLMRNLEKNGEAQDSCRVA